MVSNVHSNATNLFFDLLLCKVIEKHTTATLKVFQYQLQRRAKHTIFSAPGDITLVVDGLL